MDTPVCDYPALLRLDGQVHVVVGAGRGMGAECARALASAGARVACLDIDEELAAQVAGEIDGIALPADVTDDRSLSAAFGSIERDSGAVHGVVDIVGMVRWTPLREADGLDWDWQDSIVARQALRVLRTAVPLLERAGGGALTFVSSVSALTSAPGHGLYGMSKAALCSMVRTAAIEVGPVGIRVNAVLPGATRTPTLESRATFDSVLADAARRTPLRRVAEPSDIAATLLYLSSGLARHVTAQNLVVDGGLSQTWPLSLPEGAA
jgi:NAD(P)-dependent dehydrogenase (short-subunit alcohol dehydrogenase family)